MFLHFYTVFALKSLASGDSVTLQFFITASRPQGWVDNDDRLPSHLSQCASKISRDTYLSFSGTSGGFYWVLLGAELFSSLFYFNDTMVFMSKARKKK